MPEKELTPEQVAFKDRVERWKEAEAINCTNLDELKIVYKKWLYLEEKDNDFVDVALAALLDREIPGDPVWLYLIAPPGGVKSELLRSFKVYPRAYTLDTLTSATFVSGMAEKDKETGEMVPVAGILQDLDGKTVVVKDLTTLLQSAEEGRNEIYGQLRSIYDGFYEKAFGSIRRKVSITATIGLVCGVTPVIDRYSAMHSVLGERFIKKRSNPNKWEAATRALQNEGHEALMRQEIANGVKTFIESLSFNVVPEPTADQAQDILKMAMYVALMRANVWSKYSDSGQVVDMEVVTSEVPTRIAKQLKHLAKLLAVVRGHPTYIDDADMDTLAGVAQDTAEIKKQLIMMHVIKWGINGDYDPADIAGSTPKLFRTNVRNHFNILTSLECMTTNDKGYTLTEEFKPYLRAAFRLLPSENTLEARDKRLEARDKGRGHTPLPPDPLQKEPEKGLFSKGMGGKGVGGSLTEKMDTISSYLQKQYVDPTTNELAEELGLDYDEALKILGILETREKRVFQPRSGYWRLT